MDCICIVVLCPLEGSWRFSIVRSMFKKNICDKCFGVLSCYYCNRKFLQLTRDYSKIILNVFSARGLIWYVHSCKHGEPHCKYYLQRTLVRLQQLLLYKAIVIIYSIVYVFGYTRPIEVEMQRGILSALYHASSNLKMVREVQYIILEERWHYLYMGPCDVVWEEDGMVLLKPMFSLFDNH